jgi:hypothetical protein
MTVASDVRRLPPANDVTPGRCDLGGVPPPGYAPSAADATHGEADDTVIHPRVRHDPTQPRIRRTAPALGPG